MRCKRPSGTSVCGLKLLVCGPLRSLLQVYYDDVVWMVQALQRLNVPAIALGTMPESKHRCRKREGTRFLVYFASIKVQILTAELGAPLWLLLLE